MKKIYKITEEEFTAIQEAIEKTLKLDVYDSIEADNGHGGRHSMSKETFFELLRGFFIIE